MKSQRLFIFSTAVVVCSALVLATPALAAEETVIYRVTGVFSPAQETTLREAIAKLPNITLVSVDFDNAEATFRYDRAFKDTPDDPAKCIEHFHASLQHLSKGLFGITPRITTPREKLTRIEIPVSGCDCPGCNLAAYEAIAKIEGVAQATASFHDNKISALIDPAKTDRAALEKALKAKGVTVKNDAE